MAAPGVYTITPVNQGTAYPVGVNPTQPSFQTVVVDAAIQKWIVERADGGAYQLSVGGYPFCGIEDNNVIASIDSDQSVLWQIIPGPVPNTFAIIPVNNPSLGWTVQNSLDQGANVTLAPIVGIFAPTQLFVLRPFSD